MTIHHLVIDRLAASIGLKLAASTIEGWFKTCSVVPAWEKFEVLIKALGAEQDEDWRALHGKALAADRKRKKEERIRKELAGPTMAIPSEPLGTDREPVSQQLAWDFTPVVALTERSPDPAPTVPTGVVHTTAAEGSAPAGGSFWSTPQKIATVLLFVLPAVLILVFWLTNSGEPSSSAPSRSGAPSVPLTPNIHSALVWEGRELLGHGL